MSCLHAQQASPAAPWQVAHPSVGSQGCGRCSLSLLALLQTVVHSVFVHHTTAGSICSIYPAISDACAGAVGGC
jgi:hypothetical protein